MHNLNLTNQDRIALKYEAQKHSQNKTILSNKNFASIVNKLWKQFK